MRCYINQSDNFSLQEIVILIIIIFCKKISTVPGMIIKGFFFYNIRDILPGFSHLLSSSFYKFCLDFS